MTFEAPTYPASLVLSNRPCLVVGGGRVALRKVEGLLEANALVTVVAPAIEPSIRALGVTVYERPYQSGEVGDYALVIAATGDLEIDRQVAAEARAAKILVNVADDPVACTFVLPAVARHGVVSVAVSTEGTSPAFARWARDRLSGAFGKELELIAPVIARVRARVHGAGHPSEGRDWQGLIDAVHQASARGGSQAAEQVAQNWADRWLDEGRPGKSR